MGLKHKHGNKYGGHKINTSAGLVRLDADGVVTNEDDCDAKALLASGNFVDTDAEPGEFPEPVTEEESGEEGDWEDLDGPHPLHNPNENDEEEAPKLKKKKRKKKTSKKKKKKRKKKV